MFGLGLFGWAIFAVGAGIAVLLLHHLRPVSGRHAAVSVRVELSKPVDNEDLDETLIVGDLFGSDVISGYRVSARDGEDATAAGPRPYLEHYWRRQVEQTAEIADFAWFSGRQKENESPALAMIG